MQFRHIGFIDQIGNLLLYMLLCDFINRKLGTPAKENEPYPITLRS